MASPSGWRSSRMSSGHGVPNHAPFILHPDRPRPLLIGEGAGIGPIIGVAERLREPPWKPLVLLGSDTPFPFRTHPSAVIIAGIPTPTIACMPLLEQWGIPSRLASTMDLPGCFEGRVIDLAATWLASLGPTQLAEVEIFSCGPAGFLQAVEALARQHAVPCQSWNGPA